MTNHAPVFTSSSATGSFNENSNTTGSSASHQLTGTMSFKDSDKSDTHSTSASLSSAVLSSGSVIPASSLSHFQTAMSSQILSDSNGNGSLKWTFSDADSDFDFLAKNQTLALTYNIKVSDNHGGFVTQTVKITVTGTDDKPVVAVEPITIVTEQANETLSLSPDIAHITLDFTDQDLTNTGHTASVTAVSATGNTAGLLPGLLGTAELMAFFHVDNVVKNSGSSTGVINTTFAAPDLAFDYLAAGEELKIVYTVRLDDHAGGISTQIVNVTVVGTNDKPVFLCGPDVAHLTEGQDLSPSGDLTTHGDLAFSDIDLSDTHTVSTTVTASLSGGGSVPLTDAQLLAAFHTSLGPDSTGHLLGDVDWSFALDNDDVNFLSSGQTLTLTYHLTLADGAGGSATQDVTVTILGTNHPVVITSGPGTAEAFELADTTGSAVLDTTTTVPSGTLDFADTDTGDTHTVAVTLGTTSWSAGGSTPAGTLADLAGAVTTTLHDSIGTGSGSVDWTFAIPDHDMDFLAAGETLTVNYDVAVGDASTTAHQTVSVTVTGANDAVAMTGGPGSASVDEQDNVTNSPALVSTTPVPTGTLSFEDVDLSDVHEVTVTVNSAVWSVDPFFVPGETLADLQSALTTTLNDSTGAGAGTIDWSFAIADRDLDFLSAGETLTVTYDVSVWDGASNSTQTVTITLNGADDPVIATPVSAAVTDSPFPDAGQVVATGVLADLAHPIDLSSSRTITEVNGSAANVGQPVAGAYGSLYLFADGTYSYIANSAMDPLQVGDNPDDQFTFTVADTHGHTSTSTLTFNITGGDDIPVITAAVANASVTEDAGPTVIVNGGFESGDLSGWTTSGSHISAQQLEFGGGFGHYTAYLAPTGSFETLSQDVATTPGQHYFLSFTVIGDAEAGSSPLTVTWGGMTLLSLGNVPAGINQYTFEVIGDGSASATSLQFTYADDGSGMYLDQVNVNPATGPATETADGTIAFTDIETADTHTASFVPLGTGYLGTFSLDPVSESGGSGSVAWHYTVNNADFQFLAAGETLVYDYLVTVTDDHGGSTTQDVTITLVGTNDGPAAVDETIISDAGASGVIDIPAWALAMNDTDPDTTDHLFVDSIGSSSGGSAVPFGDVFFVDDATPGGSFTYNSSDGSATSNFATATVINNAASSTVLTGTSGDDIIIATNGTETLNGGGGNDVLIGSAGGHTMTGGAGSDGFAFLSTSDGPGVITDFNNTTESDHIVISADGFGGGLTAGMDVTSLFETSADDQFSGSGAVFHFDSANQTLYFSADGSQASAIAVTTVQSGVALNPHDLLIV